MIYETQIYYVNHRFNKITYVKKEAFSYYGTPICNSLHKNIKECTSLDNLKIMIKSWVGPKS